MRSAGLLISTFIAVSITVSAVPADAGGRSRSRTRQRTTQTTTTRQRPPQTTQTANRRLMDRQREQAIRERQIAKSYLKARTQTRRNNARFFEKITQRRDYNGEYVMHRDAKTTAFLDISDPKHPRYDPKREAEDESSMSRIPPHKRVHILVVPNVKREHIGQSLNGSIGAADLKASLEIVKSAEKLAAQLKIKNPKVFINSEARIGVGYLHVHIVGERGSSTQYPAAMTQ